MKAPSCKLKEAFYELKAKGKYACEIVDCRCGIRFCARWVKSASPLLFVFHPPRSPVFLLTTSYIPFLFAGIPVRSLVFITIDILEFGHGKRGTRLAIPRKRAILFQDTTART